MAALRSFTDDELADVEVDLARCEAERAKLAGRASWMAPDSYRDKVGWQIDALDRAISRYRDILKEGT